MSKDFERILNEINEEITLDNVKLEQMSKNIARRKLELGGFRIEIWYSYNKPMKIEFFGHAQFIEIYNK